MPNYLPSFATSPTLVISDIHAVLEGLDAVLRAAAGKFVNFLSLGDAVGYGANPNEVLEMLRQLEETVGKLGGAFLMLAGNHDEAALELRRGNLRALEQYNDHAAESLLWTAKELKQGNAEWLAQKILVGGEPRREITTEKFMAAHGGPGKFAEGYIGYSFTPKMAAAEMGKSRVLLLGHTHKGKKYPVRGKMIYSLPSAGIPRDKDPRLGFGIFYPADERLETIRIQSGRGDAARKVLALAEEGRISKRSANTIVNCMIKGG